MPIMRKKAKQVIWLDPQWNNNQPEDNNLLSILLEEFDINTVLSGKNKEFWIAIACQYWYPDSQFFFKLYFLKTDLSLLCYNNISESTISPESNILFAQKLSWKNSHLGNSNKSV